MWPGKLHSRCEWVSWAVTPLVPCQRVLFTPGNPQTLLMRKLLWNALFFLVLYKLFQDAEGHYQIRIGAERGRMCQLFPSCVRYKLWDRRFEIRFGQGCMSEVHRLVLWWADFSTKRCFCSSNWWNCMRNARIFRDGPKHDAVRTCLFQDSRGTHFLPGYDSIPCQHHVRELKLYRHTKS